MEGRDGEGVVRVAEDGARAAREAERGAAEAGLRARTRRVNTPPESLVEQESREKARRTMSMLDQKPLAERMSSAMSESNPPFVSPKAPNSPPIMAPPSSAGKPMLPTPNSPPMPPPPATPCALASPANSGPSDGARLLRYDSTPLPPPCAGAPPLLPDDGPPAPLAMARLLM